MTRVQKTATIFTTLAVVALFFVLYDLQHEPETKVQASSDSAVAEISDETTKSRAVPIVPIAFEEESKALLLKVHDKEGMQIIEAKLVAHKPRIRRMTEADIEFEILQDHDGLIRLDPKQWRPEDLNYSVLAEGYVPEKVAALRDDGINSVGLSPDAQRVLRFVDQQGLPVPNVRVQVSSIRLAASNLMRPEESSSGTALGKLGICEVWSDSHGVAAIKGLPVGQYWALIDHETHLALEWSGATRFTLSKGEQTVRMGEVWGAAVRVSGIPITQFTISTGGCRVEYTHGGGGGTWFEGPMRFSNRLREKLDSSTALIWSFVPSGPVSVGDPITNIPVSITPVGGRTSLHQVASRPISLIRAPEIIHVDPPLPGNVHPLVLEIRQPDGSMFADLSHRFTIMGKTSEGESYFSILDSPHENIALGAYTLQPTSASPLSGFIPAKRFEIVPGPNTVEIDLPMRIDAYLLKIATSVRERPAIYSIDTIFEGKVVTRSYTNLSEEHIILASSNSWSVEVGAEGFKSTRIHVPNYDAAAPNSLGKTLEFILEPSDP